MLRSLAGILACAIAAQMPQAPTSPAPPRPSQTVSAAKNWVGHQPEFEQYLKTAKIVRFEPVPVGVTKPLRGYFAAGGLAGSFIFKPLQPGMIGGYFESYKSEIAAYELDKLLGLGMVPPTVERRVGEWGLGSVQLWVENVRVLKDTAANESRDLVRWNREVYRQWVFDDLIANIDRNQANMLVDSDWNLVLIDHSRAFTGTGSLPYKLERIDRQFLDSLRALTDARVKATLGPLLFDGPKPFLKRRDRILQQFDTLIAERGEAEVVIP
jgi:hypothetical protein